MNTTERIKKRQRWRRQDLQRDEEILKHVVNWSVRQFQWLWPYRLAGVCTMYTLRKSKFRPRRQYENKNIKCVIKIKYTLFYRFNSACFWPKWEKCFSAFSSCRKTSNQLDSHKITISLSIAACLACDIYLLILAKKRTICGFLCKIYMKRVRFRRHSCAMNIFFSCFFPCPIESIVIKTNVSVNLRRNIHSNV